MPAIVRVIAFLLSVTPFSTLHADDGSAGYQLGAGDVVRIHVYGEEDLSFEQLLVGESGIISYPFLGEIRLKGITIKALEQRLMDGLKPDYLIDPKILVSIVAYRPFFVSGEVKSPGSYGYQPGLTVRQAISLAGGFTERASKSKITIVSDLRGGSEEPVKVGLGDQVSPGDSITIDQSLF